MTEPLVLLIEDEASLASFIKTELELEGYQVLWAADGQAGLELFGTNQAQITLILLDWLLPIYDGLTVLRRIRKKSQVPVIMLTARDQVQDMITGLDVGGDDYLTKPFEIEVLFARMRVILRRLTKQQTTPAPTSQLQYHDFILDLAKHEVTVKGEVIELTPKEFGILYELIKEPETVKTRDELLDSVWGENYFGQTNTIDVYIRSLRKKLGSAGKSIQTLRSLGYLLRDEENDKQNQ